jgi:hypothetical protein
MLRGMTGDASPPDPNPEWSPGPVPARCLVPGESRIAVSVDAFRGSLSWAVVLRRHRPGPRPASHPKKDSPDRNRRDVAAADAEPAPPSSPPDDSPPAWIHIHMQCRIRHDMMHTRAASHRRTHLGWRPSHGAWPARRPPPAAALQRSDAANAATSFLL